MPGVAVFSRRALPLAAWTNGLEIAGGQWGSRVCWGVGLVHPPSSRSIMQYRQCAGCGAFSHGLNVNGVGAWRPEHNRTPSCMMQYRQGAGAHAGLWHWFDRDCGSHRQLRLTGIVGATGSLRWMGKANS